MYLGTANTWAITTVISLARIRPHSHRWFVVATGFLWQESADSGMTRLCDQHVDTHRVISCRLGQMSEPGRSQLTTTQSTAFRLQHCSEPQLIALCAATCDQQWLLSARH